MIEDVKTRLMADSGCERISLFLCTTEEDKGDSSEAINERGELMGGWLFPDGHMDIRPYRADEIDHDDLLTDLEYLAARIAVGLDS